MSVTVEILLVWTNVARTIVAWTNVNVTVGICFRCSQEPTFKVSSKSVQDQLTLSLCGVVVGWFAKSFSCQTQLKVMLG